MAQIIWSEVLFLITLMIIFIQIPTLFTLLAYNTDLDVGIHLLPWVLLYYYTTEHRYLFFISIKVCLLLVVRVFNYTGWLVTGGTSGKGVILREKRSRKYRIKIFRSRFVFEKIDFRFRSVRVHFITSRYNVSHCRSLSRWILSQFKFVFAVTEN